MRLHGWFRQLGDSAVVLHVLVTAVIMVSKEGKLRWAFLCRRLEVVVLGGRKWGSSLTLMMELEPSLALEDIPNLI